jgi:hypothetical protein
MQFFLYKTSIKVSLLALDADALKSKPLQLILALIPTIIAKTIKKPQPRCCAENRKLP